jgi:nucleotide-binding universal stress UspA family protein
MALYPCSLNEWNVPQISTEGRNHVMKGPGYIVVGVDGSPSSLDALQWAVGQAALTGADIRAVIAWEYPPLSGVDPMTAHVDWPTKAQQTIDAGLEKAVATDAVKVSSAALERHPAQVLLDASVGAELLVVGNSGHGGFTESLPGSLREHVIANATCPVLVMRHDIRSIQPLTRVCPSRPL